MDCAGADLAGADVRVPAHAAARSQAAQHSHARVRAARSRLDARGTPAPHGSPDKRLSTPLSHALPLCDARTGAARVCLIGIIGKTTCVTSWAAPAASSQQQLQICGQWLAVGVPAAAGLKRAADAVTCGAGAASSFVRSADASTRQRAPEWREHSRHLVRAERGVGERRVRTARARVWRVLITFPCNLHMKRVAIKACATVRVARPKSCATLATSVPM